MELGEKIIRFIDLYNRRDQVVNRMVDKLNYSDEGAIDDTWDAMYDMLLELWKEWFDGDKESFDEFESGDLAYFEEDRYLYCLSAVAIYQTPIDVRRAMWMILDKITEDKTKQWKEDSEDENR